MVDINAISDQIQGLTLLEASQLVKLLDRLLRKVGRWAHACVILTAPQTRPTNPQRKPLPRDRYN